MKFDNIYGAIHTLRNFYCSPLDALKRRVALIYRDYYYHNLCYAAKFRVTFSEFCVRVGGEVAAFMANLPYHGEVCPKMFTAYAPLGEACVSGLEAFYVKLTKRDLSLLGQRRVDGIAGCLRTMLNPREVNTGYMRGSIVKCREGGEIDRTYRTPCNTVTNRHSYFSHLCSVRARAKKIYNLQNPLEQDIVESVFKSTVCKKCGRVYQCEVEKVICEIFCTAVIEDHKKRHAIRSSSGAEQNELLQEYYRQKSGSDYVMRMLRRNEEFFVPCTNAAQVVSSKRPQRK